MIFINNNVSYWFILLLTLIFKRSRKCWIWKWIHSKLVIINFKLWINYSKWFQKHCAMLSPQYMILITQALLYTRLSCSCSSATFQLCLNFLCGISLIIHTFLEDREEVLFFLFTYPKGLLLKAEHRAFLKRHSWGSLLREMGIINAQGYYLKPKKHQKYSPSSLLLISAFYLFRAKLMKGKDCLDEEQALWLLMLTSRKITRLGFNILHYDSLIDSGKWQ